MICVPDRPLRAPRRDQREAAPRLRRARPVPPGLGRPREPVPLLLAGAAAGASAHPRAAAARHADRGDPAVDRRRRPGWRAGTPTRGAGTGAAPGGGAARGPGHHGGRRRRGAAPGGGGAGGGHDPGHRSGRRLRRAGGARPRCRSSGAPAAGRDPVPAGDLRAGHRPDPGDGSDLLPAVARDPRRVGHPSRRVRRGGGRPSSVAALGGGFRPGSRRADADRLSPVRRRFLAAAAARLGRRALRGSRHGAPAAGRVVPSRRPALVRCWE